MRRALGLFVGAVVVGWGAPAFAILRSNVLADAQSWVDAAVPYSQGPWGSYCSWDYCYEDPLRDGDCYRSDCSGFVSATWGLAAPGRNTTGLCDGTIAHEIDWDDLLPGDALIDCGHHVMLFKEWVDGDTFEAYEEYSCGETAEQRRHRRSTLRDSGYFPLRLDAIEDDPPPNAPPTGSLDTADCTVSGWAQDPDAPETALGVHVYVGGPAGDPNAVGLDHGPAGRARDDLCAAIGSCNHAFDLELPPAFRDGAARDVYAYSFDASEGFPVLLPGSPRAATCGRMSPPVAPEEGVRRWVTNAASFDAWQWTGLDVAPLEDAAVNEYAPGPDLPDAPVAVQADDGSPEVWVLDQGTRRHVIDGASLAAWRFDGNVHVLPASEVYANLPGLDWPAEPFVFRGSGPEVYVIDFAPPEPVDLEGPEDGAPWSDDPGSPGYAGGPGAMDPTGGLSAAGCSVTPTGDTSDALIPLLLALVPLLARRRRFS